MRAYSVCKHTWKSEKRKRDKGMQRKARDGRVGSCHAVREKRELEKAVYEG